MPTNNKAKDLKDSLRFTHLDVENAGFRSGSVTGFGFNNKDLKTQYPSTTTGEPTPTQYPAGPAKRFVSNFGPQNVYLDQVDIIKQNGPLLRSLKSSKLDNIDSPINTDIGDPTVYPSDNVTGKPSPTSYPTTAPKKFEQVNNNLNPYLDQVNVKQENGPLEQSLESSKLDDDKVTDLFLRNLDRKLLKGGDKTENVRKYISKYIDSLQQRTDNQDSSDDFDVEDEFVYGGLEPEKSAIGRKQFKKELIKKVFL